MSSAPVFSRPILIGWIAAAIVTFGCSLYFMGREEGPSGSEAAGPSTFSRSAIGYAGFADTLQRLGIRAVKSQHDSPEKVGAAGVLVIAEPRVQSDQSFRALLEAKSVLLVLPKWDGRPSERKTGWVSHVVLKPFLEAQWTVNRVAQKADVVRQELVTTWTTNTLGPVPTIASPVQLVRSDRLQPIIAAAQGILVGEIVERGRRVWVLSDPDVIANHGLGHEGNAALGVAIIDALRGEGGPVVFDETVHGYEVRPASPFLLMFKFPFVVATMLGALAVVLLLWATVGRFGAPQAAPAPLSAGRRGLIENVAKLIEFAGHRQLMVGRYVEATIRDVARQIRAPRGMSDRALRDWLRRVGDARAVAVDFGAVLRQADRLSEERRSDPAQLARIAHDIHRWRQEIMDGRSRHSRDH